MSLPTDDRANAPWMRVLRALGIFLALICVALLIGMLSFSAAWGAERKAKVKPIEYTGREWVISHKDVRWHDADTPIIYPDTSKAETFRFYGADAPELDQTCWLSNGQPYQCGQVALDILLTRIEGHTLTCREVKTPKEDLYDRPLVLCFVDDEPDTSLSYMLVEAGWAVPFKSKAYALPAAKAMQGNFGMHEGSFAYPEDFRRWKKQQTMCQGYDPAFIPGRPQHAVSP